MKKNRLIILGFQAINTAIIAETLCKNEKNEIVVAKTDDKNILNPQFEPEPILFHNMRFNYEHIKIEEPPRNKFFDKPRNNFKKR